MRKYQVTKLLYTALSILKMIDKCYGIIFHINTMFEGIKKYVRSSVYTQTS